MSPGDGGHLVVDVLWKNATGRHHRNIDVATQTDPPTGCTGVTHPALPSPLLSDRYDFLHGSTADLNYNHYPRVECECNLQAEDESVAKPNPLREAPTVQDQDSGLGYMDGSGQYEEEWGEGEGGERCRELGGSGDLWTRAETSFRGPVTSDDEWSDSGMHGISHGEYQRFQKVLEEKWQLYSRASKPELGREVLEEAETGNKWEKKVEERKPGGLRKCKSGEVSGPGQDTGHWSLERTLVVEQQKDLQTCQTSNETHCRVRSKSCHQNPAQGAPSPSNVEASVPDPALGVTTSCDDAREGAGREQRSGQDSWPDSRRRRESDSGHGWLHIPRRARHYRSYMQLVQQRAAVECSADPSDAGGNTIGPGRRSEAVGSSLAAKKQTRERLRQRAARIGEQRGASSTEDDGDALSEIKMGRHWSRVDRQQQWAQARDRRQRKEVRSRLEEVVSERAQSAGGGETRAAGIIELSRGLASRRRNKKVFDNWVTIQELLAHGSRAADGTVVYSPLLSVTTV